jgi:hypothetical protein
MPPFRVQARRRGEAILLAILHSPLSMLGGRSLYLVEERQEVTMAAKPRGQVAEAWLACPSIGVVGADCTGKLDSIQLRAYACVMLELNFHLFHGRVDNKES